MDWRYTIALHLVTSSQIALVTQQSYIMVLHYSVTLRCYITVLHYISVPTSIMLRCCGSSSWKWNFMFFNVVCITQNLFCRQSGNFSQRMTNLWKMPIGFQTIWYLKVMWDPFPHLFMKKIICIWCTDREISAKNKSGVQICTNSSTINSFFNT